MSHAPSLLVTSINIRGGTGWGTVLQYLPDVHRAPSSIPSIKETDTILYFIIWFHFYFFERSLYVILTDMELAILTRLISKSEILPLLSLKC